MSPESPTREPDPGVPHLLLTWNPGPDDDHAYDPESWDAEVVAPCVAGVGADSTWGVGRHRTGVGPGVGALLYRQGAHGRGIVARGVVTSEVLVGERTRTPGRITRYVGLRWTEAVPIERRLDLRDLELAVPDFGWRTVYSSGRTLPPAVRDAVLEEWRAVLAEAAIARSPRGHEEVTDG